METGLVSIIVPTLNAGKYIRNCLESIQNQSYRNYEVILVDGGSIDDTLNIARGFSNLTIISQKDEGLAGAWNDGIRASNGTFLTFLDSDDSWETSTLEKHVSLLQNNSDKICSIGEVRFVLDDPSNPPAEFKLALLENSHLAYMPGCFMGRKEIISEIGLYETRWEIASDIVWFAKVKALGDRVGVINDIMLHKRVHHNNLSYNTAKSPIYNKEIIKLLFESIRAKRSKGE